MKKYYPLVGILLLVKLAIHLIGNRNYGFHRDELLHLSTSEHLSWGYFEFPPFIALIGKIAHLFFGYSLSGVRFFSTLAGLGVLWICCLIAKELGGKGKAILLAGVAVIAFLPFFRNHTLFQPVAFDQFFWTLGFYFLIKYFKTKHAKFLVFLGIAAGLGLMNKYTILVWGIGIAAGLLSYEKASVYKNKWLYISVSIAFVIFLPNILWQYQHHFPLFMHLQKLKESQLDEIGPYDFVIDQIKHPFTFILSMIGLIAYFRDEDLKKYKSIGITTLVIFALMWIMQSKSYYFFAIYPVLFAAGAVKIEKWLQTKPNWNYAVIAVLLIAMPFLPEAIPVLPIESYVEFADLKSDKNGRIELNDDYADMFGWDEQVKLVDSLYQSLPDDDKKHCMIWAENYGEAGAIKILGENYQLPDPVCAHGSFWTWGPGKTDNAICISIGNEKESVDKVFEERILIKMITHKYAIDEENNIPVYICRKPKINLKKIWPTLEKNVFD
ncbi:glycosyltransferase family 39 protein [Flavobacterium sp. GT3R68]|uniref:ArnT family glycosyltransferase n=1 Tax=Flavobacterium sp. GT3R68 TaxID=2594437 RepID=UPI000F866CF1|nr:glycosyltransferase family 39 protein [Flavobacterium sp. GT3R68]RTY92399.1 glycosyltransferase family 39 protein [Flavobacterium sp. GSN2]TRW92315.1 glycosyltransferase family 39 protein [Flavobacterium sp. GT3R68]